jgi:hypothetical protein
MDRLTLCQVVLVVNLTVVKLKENQNGSYE